MTTIHTQALADPLAGIATRCHRLLLTGAGGNLGKVLRERLTRYAEVLRVSDITDLAPRAPAKKLCRATWPMRRRSMRW